MARSIAIVGGGVAGWMSALSLAATGRAVSLIEVPGPDLSAGPFGPAESTAPGFGRFLDEHGIAPADFSRESCPVAVTLGNAAASWAGEQVNWFLPFGETGAPMGAVAFHQLAARLRSLGRDVRLGDYSLAALAAQSGRFATPGQDPRSPLSSFAFGFNIDRAGFAEMLKRRALAKGVTLHPAPFRDAEITDRVVAVTLENGDRIEADLWLDCSGPQALLASRLSPFESWSEWLPCDRVLQFAEDSEAPPPLYSISAANAAGWDRAVSVAGGYGRATFYASSHADLGGDPYAPGRRARMWTANCIAIGAAAAVIDPVHPIAFGQVQSALARLRALFPTEDGSVEAAEYNRLMHAEADRARDFMILPWKANARHGEPLWDAARAMSVPDTLQYKLDLWLSRGRVPIYDEEPFDRPDWIVALDGMGLRPRRWDALADAISEADLLAHFQRVRDALIAAGRTMQPVAGAMR